MIQMSLASHDSRKKVITEDSTWSHAKSDYVFEELSWIALDQMQRTFLSSAFKKACPWIVMLLFIYKKGFIIFLVLWKKAEMLLYQSRWDLGNGGNPHASSSTNWRRSHWIESQHVTEDNVPWLCSQQLSHSPSYSFPCLSMWLYGAGVCVVQFQGD